MNKVYQYTKLYLLQVYDQGQVRNISKLAIFDIKINQKYMSTPILIANILTLLAFFLHTFQGDKELRLIEPADAHDKGHIKREKWTMARSGWHWVSFDLLFATIGLGLINFTDYFQHENLLLQIMAVYFFGYGVVWLIGIAISKSFPQNYIKLGQWILLWVISALIYWGVG